MRRALLIASVASLAACGPSPVPRATPELVGVARADAPEVTVEDLDRGRAIYVTRCNTCHSLPRPVDYDAPTWRKWMHSMAPKAKLDEVQAADALRYVLAVRRAQAAAP